MTPEQVAKLLERGRRKPGLLSLCVDALIESIEGLRADLVRAKGEAAGERLELRAEVARLTEATEKIRRRSYAQQCIDCGSTGHLSGSVVCNLRESFSGVLPAGSHPTAEYRPEDSAAFGDDGGSVRKEKG